MHRVIRYFVAAFAVATLAAALWAAASAVVGIWECVSTTSDGEEMELTLTLAESDGQLNATATGGDRQWKLSKVRFDGKVLSFTATAGYDEYTVTINVDGDKMEGTWTGGEDTGKITGTRRKSQ